jgi:hypothetical protein
MAKGKSKKPVKVVDPQEVASGETAKKAPVPRGVRKHLRELESQLADAARKEQKRLQKLEKSRQRRQSIGSALDKLRGRTAITPGPAPAAAPALAGPAGGPTQKTVRSRTSSGRFAASPRPATTSTSESTTTD